MLAAKYTWDPFKFYAGYEHIQQFNPTNPLGVGASAQGGYLLSGVEDNNLDSPKLVQVGWTGVKYAFDSKTDITLSYYHQWQNNFRVPSACPPSSFRASCSGFLNEVSLYADHHFTKRFDVFAGITYSNVSGGLAIAIPHGPGVPLLVQQQHCSGNRRSFHVLIAFRGVLNGEPARAGAEATRWVRRGAFGQSESRRVGKYRQCFAPDGYRLTGELG